MTESFLLKNGLMIDGTGTRPRRADLRIVGDTLVQVGADLAPGAEVVLDLRGLAVAPGFIDVHSHADGGIEQLPGAQTQIRQGITTAIVGQDGGSNVPLAQWFARRKQQPAAIHFASFVGHGTVRGRILGDDWRRAATAAEIAAMAALIDQEMRAGALGLSSGLEYDPGSFATTDELIALAKAAAAHGGLYISHVRDEEDEAFIAFDELIRIAREAKLPAEISHIKLASAPVWGRTREVFARLEAARRQGVTITADVYPYTYWQSGITTLMTTREWDRQDLWTQALESIGGAQNVRITGYAPEPSWQGQTLDVLATRTGKDPAALVVEMVAAAKGAVGVVVTAMQEKDVRAFIAHPQIVFCTDGGLQGTHPRGAGSYPRILGRYVREQRVLSLEAAVHKATGLPAARLGLKSRGVIAPGKKADLVAFDPKTVHDTATPQDPRAEPIGIVHVLVHGVPVLRDGRPTGALPGRPIRRGE
jgi:N-acyl-D-amino-acid deacylase